MQYICTIWNYWNSYQFKLKIIIEKSSEYFVQSQRILKHGNNLMLMFIYRETRIKKQDIKVTIYNHKSFR